MRNGNRARQAAHKSSTRVSLPDDKHLGEGAGAHGKHDPLESPCTQRHRGWKDDMISARLKEDAFRGGAFKGGGPGASPGLAQKHRFDETVEPGTQGHGVLSSTIQSCRLAPPRRVQGSCRRSRLGRWKGSAVTLTTWRVAIRRWCLISPLPWVRYQR